MTPGEGRSPAACRSPDAVAPSRSRPDTEQEEVVKKSLGRHSPVCSSPGGGGNNLVRISLAECLRARQDVAPRSPLQFHPRKQNRHREPDTRMKQHRPHGWVTHAHPRGLCARLRGQGGDRIPVRACESDRSAREGNAEGNASCQGPGGRGRAVHRPSDQRVLPWAPQLPEA